MANRWQKIGKQILLGEFAVVVKRCDEGEKRGEYGLSFSNGEGRGSWLGLGDSLSVVAVRDAIDGKVAAARHALSQAQELAALAETLMDHVAEIERSEAKGAKAPKVDSEKLLQAAREALAVNGILPPANAPHVMQLAKTLINATQSAADQPAAK